MQGAPSAVWRATQARGNAAARPSSVPKSGNYFLPCPYIVQATNSLALLTANGSMQQFFKHCLCAACAIGLELHDKYLKLSRINSSTHLAHQSQVIVQVMNRIQSCPQNFTRPVQMMQVSP